MIDSLRGILLESDAQSAVIECCGIGYRCAAGTNTLKDLPRPGNETFVFTHLFVRDDGIELYAFLTRDEREMFRMLINVSGVGPKAAISLLSRFKPRDLSLCIASGDVKSLTGAAGIGAKTAQRIILECKDKITSASAFAGEASNAAAAAENSGTGEAVSALVSLGYSVSEASSAVARLDPELPVDRLIKEALKLLSRGL